MKQIFRDYRGEFNGHYLKALVRSCNRFIKDVIDEFARQATFVWKLEHELVGNESPVLDEDIINIARIAGLVPPIAYGRSSLGSIQFAKSHIVNGKERSERGLMNMRTGVLEYVRTEQDNYFDDIVNEATENLRATFVPDTVEPIGFLPYGKQLYTPQGEVIWDNLLEFPPTDGTPYTEFYGEKYLTFEEYFNKEVIISINIFKALFECVQQIRFFGLTVDAFLNVTRILCLNFVHNIEITRSANGYVVFYDLNSLSEITDKDQRLAAWQEVVAKKFIHLTLVERL